MYKMCHSRLSISRFLVNCKQWASIWTQWKPNLVKRVPILAESKHVKSKSKANAPVTLSPGHQDSSHIPDLHSNRQDAVLQAQVAKHLKELTDSEKPGTKLKSLRVGGSRGSHVSQPH